MNRFWSSICIGMVTLCQLSAVSAQETFSPEERARRVARAEAEAKKAFQQNHYTFVTPHGAVDPAQGGLPPFATGLRRWRAYRGNLYIDEARLLEMLGKQDEARKVRMRKVGAATLTGVASVEAGLAAGLPDLNTGVRGVGVLGGFALGLTGMFFYDRNSSTVDDLFLPLQRLNDTIRENLRAQYRLQYGVPMEPPVERPPAPPAVSE